MGNSCSQNQDKNPRSLVCTRCWERVFDTEKYEKIFKGHELSTKLHVGSAAEIANSALAGCNLCSLLHGDLVPSSSETIQVYIYLNLYHFPHKPWTPVEKNIFQVFIEQKSDSGGGCSITRYIHAFTSLEDKAAEYVTARPFQYDFGGAKATKQIEAWTTECKNHQRCRDAWESVPLPKRVIEVSPQGASRPRLLESSGKSGIYATLSYRWGKQLFVTLGKSNHKSFEYMDIEMLPGTVRDAILVTRKLSIPYLWIDSLCIEQDSDEDKMEQIGQMGHIYASSAVTIVSARASTAFEGFLDPGPLCLGKIYAKVPVRVKKGEFCTMSLGMLDEMLYVERLEPLGKRAWTMQEQLLAQCALNFATHTMIWKCKHGARNLGDSLYFPHTRRNGLNVNFEEDTPHLCSLLPDTCSDALFRDKDQILDSWLHLVHAYSLRDCTVKCDKLNAIASLGSHVIFCSSLGSYCAGIWEYKIARQLTWRQATNNGPFRLNKDQMCYRDGDFRAPSWSWASVDFGMVEFWSEPKQPVGVTPDILQEYVKFLGCQTVPTSTLNPFGELRFAQLRLCGVVRKAWFKSSVCCSLFFLPATDSPHKEGDDVSIKDKDGTETWSLDEAIAKHDCERYSPVMTRAEATTRREVIPRLKLFGFDDEVKYWEPVVVFCLPVIDSSRESFPGRMLTKGCVDRLMLMQTKTKEGNEAYQRLGVFRGAKREVFKGLVQREIVLI